MTRISLLVTVCALLAAVLATPVGAQVSITEKQAAQDQAKRVLIHRVKKQFGAKFAPSDVSSRCGRRSGYWLCRLSTKPSMSTTAQCEGTLRLYGAPGEFRTRKIKIACAA
jgi:hypothetical protein